MESLGYIIEQSKKRDIIDLIRDIAEEYGIKFNVIDVLGINDKEHTIEIVDVSIKDTDSYINNILYKVIKKVFDEVELRIGYSIKQKRIRI